MASVLLDPRQKRGYMASVYYQPKHKRWYMASGNNRGKMRKITGTKSPYCTGENVCWYALDMMMFVSRYHYYIFLL